MLQQEYMKKKCREQSHFQQKARNKVKHLGTKLIKEVKELYSNCEALMKDIAEDTKNMEGQPVFMDREESVFQVSLP